MRNFTKEDNNNLRRILKLLFGSDLIRIGSFKRKNKTIIYLEYPVIRNVDKIEKVAERLIIAYIERYMVEEKISNRSYKHEFKIYQSGGRIFSGDLLNNYPQQRMIRIIHALR